jgi:CheY-like chemotaxis protein
MDDEDLIRTMAAQMLGKLCYDATVVEDGERALQAYGEVISAGRRFDAVILDLTLPGGMGGQETIKRLLALDPDARAIVSSGYSNDPMMSHYEDHGFKAAVKKPYLLQERSAALKKVLADK